MPGKITRTEQDAETGEEHERETVAVHSFETPRWRLRRGRQGAELVGADLGRRAVAVALDDPGLVVAPPELQQRQAELLDGGEAPDPQEVFLQGPDEPVYGWSPPRKGV